MICRILRTNWCAALLTLAAGAASLHGESTPEKVYRKALPSVMVLEVENSAGERFVGSAVLALGDDVAVTAWHVVWDARSVWATFEDGTRVKVLGCIDKDAERDIAALKLEKKFPQKKAVVSPDMHAIATRTYVIGAPKGYGFSISDGLISQIRRVDGYPQYQVSCPISSGNSGGPILNERGEVIAIVSWTKADAQNVSFAVPSREWPRLDLSRQVVPWMKLAKGAGPPLARRAVESGVPSGPVRPDEGDVGTFGDFKKLMEQATGKTVTVIVRDKDEQKKFTFTVPEGALK